MPEKTNKQTKKKNKTKQKELSLLISIVTLLFFISP